MTCFDAYSTSCTSCVNTLFLFKGECVQICDEGYYKNIIENVCELCDSSCLTCSGRY